MCSKAGLSQGCIKFLSSTQSHLFGTTLLSYHATGYNHCLQNLQEVVFLWLRAPFPFAHLRRVQSGFYACSATHTKLYTLPDRTDMHNAGTLITTVLYTDHDMKPLIKLKQLLTTLVLTLEMAKAPHQA